ncbi:carboxypeptidase-like regulatory domain-containing protein [uncultured Croceitalea sp.]|uniref:carboxypeptidase-like regulatory domain-containing protein n=1 Tax=uncultured Croceitalea sp. TaxID=1798908 RepID=UPI003305CADC
MSSVEGIGKQSLKGFVELLFFFMAITVMPQKTLTGKIVASINGNPLPYVNIGIINKSIGTVTDFDGNFELSIYRSNYKDSVRISSVGLKSKTLLVSNFISVLKADPVIEMNEKIEELSEVIVSNRKLKTKVLGNRSKSRKNLYEASADMLGSEIGVKIKIKNGPSLLKKFTTRVLTKRYVGFKFRLNFYDIKEGLPNRNLLTKNIIIDAKDIEDGWIHVNLEPYDVYVEDDFFVTLEWIQGDGKRKLKFPASLFGPVVVERETSQAKWNKHTTASIGFNVTVQY